MENASKALLMAAGILISVMLISLGTYLFAIFGNYSKDINDRLSQKDIDEFNTQFTKYETEANGSNLCTAYDIVSVINLVQDINSKNGYELDRSKVADGYNNKSNIYIYVEMGAYNGKSITENSTESELNFFIGCNDITKDNRHLYKCYVTVSETTGLVKKIYFDLY